MAQEIERKFLVSGDGWQSAAISAAALRQIYITATRDRSVRIRIADDNRAWLTVKLGGELLTRQEFEYEIPLADAEAMADAAIGIPLYKTRFRVPHADHVWEVDVYDGAYSGLVVAEVELHDENERPLLPLWAGAEITGDSRFANIVMATADPEAWRKGFGLPPLSETTLSLH